MTAGNGIDTAPGDAPPDDFVGLIGSGGAILSDPAAEKLLIGCILLYPDRFAEAAAEMVSDDFTDALYRRVFDCFAEGDGAGYTVTFKSVVESVGGDSGKPIFGDMTLSQHLAGLAASAPADLPLGEVARHLHECAERRYNETADDFSDPVAAFASKFNAIWFHEVAATKPTRNWLLKNMILARSFGIAYGPPGCGKSFLMTDMVLNCAAAWLLRPDKRPDWFGYRGRQFGTVYVVAEGRDDFEIRIHAWRLHHNIPPDAVVPFVFLPTSIDMRSNEADTLKLVEEVKSLSAIMKRECGVEVDLVVIDTVARALSSGNENASEVMGAFISNCGKLQERVGVAVLGVHHGGKEGGRGPRGHEALHGAADFEIEVLGPTDEEPNQWIVRKMKAGPNGKAHRFRLRQYAVGQDHDGDDITSCVCVEIPRDREAEASKPEPGQKAAGLRLSNQEAMFFQCVLDGMEGNGVVPPRELALPASVARVVDYEQVKALMARKMLREEDNTDEGKKRHRERVKTALKRTREALQRYKVVAVDNPYIWWTGRPVRGFPQTQPKPYGQLMQRADEKPLGPPGDDIGDLV